MAGRRPREIWADVVTEGERRLGRRSSGLVATGFAGGVDVMLGVVALAVTTAALETTMPRQAAHVVASLSFGIGFALVTVGRAELFTENFLIPVAAVHARRSPIAALLRLWVVTLVVNFAGLAVFAALFSVRGVLTRASLQAAGTLAAPLAHRGFAAALVSAMAAGAAMTLFTWVAAAADSAGARVGAAFIIGFMLAAPSLNHAVVGFGELIFALFAGTAGYDYGDLARNTVLAILGNLIGGLGFVFTTRLAQVRGEPE
jgi:formate/nitrite transporter FocA (FNT family)